jgi:hypothetical protein
MVHIGKVSRTPALKNFATRSGGRRRRSSNDINNWLVMPVMSAIGTYRRCEVTGKLFRY